MLAVTVKAAGMTLREDTQARQGQHTGFHSLGLTFPLSSLQCPSLEGLHSMSFVIHVAWPLGQWVGVNAKSPSGPFI